MNDSIKNLRIRFEPIMVEQMVKSVVEFLNDKIKPIKQNIGDGKQYFVMDTDLIKICQRKF